MKALRLGRGGANPGIRLGLLSPALPCDPGYYQVWTVISTFYRLLRKQPSLLQLWADYMASWQGLDTQGPFSKLLEITRQIGWSISVPWLCDHDGVQWDLTHCDLLLLRKAVSDAWVQKLAADVAQRADFDGLKGIDYEVLKRAQSRLLPADKSWLSTLRDGTFVEPKQQAKFDLSKNSLCLHCNQPDSVYHRTFVCLALAALRVPFQEVVAIAPTLSTSLCVRLLPSRNPYHGSFRQALGLQPDVDEITNLRPDGEHIHLFTDGSCKKPDLAAFSLAAYSVVSASHDVIIASGIIGGQIQTSDLAELRAVTVSRVACPR